MIAKSDVIVELDAIRFALHIDLTDLTRPRFFYFSLFTFQFSSAVACIAWLDDCGYHLSLGQHGFGVNPEHSSLSGSYQMYQKSEPPSVAPKPLLSKTRNFIWPVDRYEITKNRLAAFRVSADELNVIIGSV